MTLSLYIHLLYLIITQSDYILVSEPLDFESADLRCQELYGTHLATLETEQDRLDAGALCDTVVGRQCWIGLYKNETNNNDLLTWKSDTQTHYTRTEMEDKLNKAIGLDNDGDCIRLWVINLYDTPCHLEYPFLCDGDNTDDDDDTCDILTPYNLLFILDESTSVGHLNYISSIDFVIKLINEDINSIANISALTFSTNVNDIVYLFSDDQTNRDGIKLALEIEKNYYDGGNTNTNEALSIGLEQFVTQILLI